MVAFTKHAHNDDVVQTQHFWLKMKRTNNFFVKRKENEGEREGKREKGEGGGKEKKNK